MPLERILVEGREGGDKLDKKFPAVADSDPKRSVGADRDENRKFGVLKLDRGRGPQRTPKLYALLMYHTSAVNGDLPPKGRLMTCRRRGILAVDSVCRPGPNTSKTWPPFTSTASCDSLTISCDHVPSSSDGYFHANTSGPPLYLITSKSAMTFPPVTRCIVFSSP